MRWLPNLYFCYFWRKHHHSRISMMLASSHEGLVIRCKPTVLQIGFVVGMIKFLNYHVAWASWSSWCPICIAFLIMASQRYFQGQQLHKMFMNVVSNFMRVEDLMATLVALLYNLALRVVPVNSVHCLVN